MSVLKIQNLSKNFGKIQAVKNINFTVSENSVFGLIGRNGAGKTTTIRMLMNIYLPDEGEILFKGEKIDSTFKDKVGYLPEERGLYKKMKVIDTLLFFAEIKGMVNQKVKKKAFEYLERFGLSDRANSKIEDLSKGNQQKIQFISTILHNPEFIILDEPFSGLDPINTDLLKDIMIEMKNEGKIIILSTHLMDYAEKLCDNIAMINEGEIILNGNLKEIKQDFGKGRIVLETDSDLDFLKTSRFVEKIEHFGNQFSIQLKNESEHQQFLLELLNNKVNIRKFAANEISLHEIFVQLAGNETNEVKNVK